MEKKGYCSCDTQYAACDNGEIDCEDCRYWINVKNEFIRHFSQTDWGGSIHLMESNGDAYVRLYYYDEDRNAVFIEGLNVSETERRKGLGTKCLKICEDIGREMKATVCCLSVKKDSWMCEWYGREGYYWAGFNDNQKDEVWMEKELYGHW